MLFLKTMQVKRNKFDIPKKLHQWPTKLLKGISFPLMFNENKMKRRLLSLIVNWILKTSMKMTKNFGY
jgi:hypothetical protein